MLAASSTAIRPVIHGSPRSFEVLGTARSALYLRADAVVIAVLAADAARLPCGVVLASSSVELSLREVAPDAAVEVGGGAMRWTSNGRPVVVDVVREWQPARVRPVTPRPDRLAELRTSIAGIDIGVPVADPTDLVGRGPGLTPSGDDVLAGYLLGGRASGRPAPVVEGLHRTTALSAALIRCAVAGLCLPEVAAVVRGLGADRPLDPAPLLRIGSTSGAALAAGLLLSGRRPEPWSAGHSRPNRALAAVAS